MCSDNHVGCIWLFIATCSFALIGVLIKVVDWNSSIILFSEFGTLLILMEIIANLVKPF